MVSVLCRDEQQEDNRIGMIREQFSKKSFDGFVHDIAQYQAKLKVALMSCSRDPLNAQP